MYIKWAKITNFRGIKGGHFPFKPGLNILIGPSNIGKSTVLAAVDLVLNPNYAWWRRDVLSELDFHKKNVAKPITITLMLGCGPHKCIEDGNQCPRFEVNSEETCKLADRLIYVDQNTQKILTADDPALDTKENVEGCILVQMKAEYITEDGYVDVGHSILNEAGDVWSDLTRPMKEWIGSLLFVSGSDPSAACKLQHNSLLYRAIGDIGAWEQDYVSEFKVKLKEQVKLLAENQAKSVIERFNSQSKQLSPLLAGKPSIGIQGSDKRDLLRQVELCFESEECELPLSRYGKGMQNVASLLMATIAQSVTRKKRPPVSIVMIEEPEQNLEPQLQRSVLRFIKNLLNEADAKHQVIVTTHSPYVISADLNLDRVVKLQGNPYGGIRGLFLNQIDVDQCRFETIRRRVSFDSELLESLFANLVIVWEGDSEAGMYNAIMRNRKDVPVELLTGVNGQGSNVECICKWYRQADYDVIAIIDSDCDMPKILNESKIPFIALPDGRRIEDVVVGILMGLDGELAKDILLRTIGASGWISKRDGHTQWQDLKKVFDDNSGSNQLPLGKVLESFNFTAFPPVETVLSYLGDFKGRNYRDSLGEELVKHNIDLGVLDVVVKKLAEIWFDRTELRSYQFTASGELTLYTAT